MLDDLKRKETQDTIDLESLGGWWGEKKDLVISIAAAVGRTAIATAGTLAGAAAAAAGTTTGTVIAATRTHAGAAAAGTAGAATSCGCGATLLHTGALPPRAPATTVAVLLSGGIIVPMVRG